MDNILRMGTLSFIRDRLSEEGDGASTEVTLAPSTGAVTLGNDHVPNAVTLTIRNTSNVRMDAVEKALDQLSRDRPWNQVFERFEQKRISMDGKEWTVVVHFDEKFEKELSVEF